MVLCPQVAGYGTELQCEHGCCTDNNSEWTCCQLASEKDNSWTWSEVLLLILFVLLVLVLISAVSYILGKRRSREIESQENKTGLNQTAETDRQVGTEAAQVPAHQSPTYQSPTNQSPAPSPGAATALQEAYYRYWQQYYLNLQEKNYPSYGKG